MTDISPSYRGRRFTERARTAMGKQRKRGGLHELTITLSPTQLEALRHRAEHNDLSLSAQMRVDVDKANRGFHGNI
jgi:hypothetical protein